MIVICGPTATGKTRLGIEIAKKIGGEIVSADSMQIYKKMNIGTAKPTEKERTEIPHHMIDFIDPRSPFSVAEYQVLAKKVIEDIQRRGKTPIIVGGTGLYINSLIYEYQPSEKDDALRRELNEEFTRYGATHMYEILKEVDPVAASVIHPNNVKRVIRAIEVKRLTGESISEKNDKVSRIPCLIYVCDRDRNVLYDMINKRVDEMFDQGLEQEIKELLNEGITFDCQSMQAIGYKEFKAYFDKEISIEETKNLIKQHTRNYAKRQITWFKKFEDAIWLKSGEFGENSDRISLEYYKYFCKLK